MRAEDSVRRRPQAGPSALSFGKAGGNVPPVTRPAMRFLVGEERERMLAELANCYWALLKEKGLSRYAAGVADVSLPELEGILERHLESCTECANSMGSINTVATFTAAWNSLAPKGTKVPAGYFWMPSSDLVIHGAAVRSVGMTAEEVTHLVAEAVRAATVTSRKTKIKKGKDGELTAETTAE